MRAYVDLHIYLFYINVGYNIMQSINVPVYCIYTYFIINSGYNTMQSLIL